jgi:hypothetical protein
MKAREYAPKRQPRIKKGASGKLKPQPLGPEAVPEPNAPWGLPLLVPQTGLLLCRFLASRSRLVQSPRARQIGAHGELSQAQD